MVLWGNFLQKNIATFRCYDNISQAKYYVSPTPLQKLSNTNFEKGFLTNE